MTYSILPGGLLELTPSHSPCPCVSVGLFLPSLQVTRSLMGLYKLHSPTWEFCLLPIHTHYSHWTWEWVRCPWHHSLLSPIADSLLSLSTWPTVTLSPTISVVILGDFNIHKYDPLNDLLHNPLTSTPLTGLSFTLLISIPMSYQCRPHPY